MTDHDRPPIWQPETYGPQPGTQQHAGYGVSGQPYSGATPEPEPLPHRPWQPWQVAVIAATALFMVAGLLFVVWYLTAAPPVLVIR